MIEKPGKKKMLLFSGSSNQELIYLTKTYSKTDEAMLIKNGFQIVIYANHMLRAAYPAMENAATSILKNQRSYELENKISSVKKVINLIK